MGLPRRNAGAEAGLPRRSVRAKAGQGADLLGSITRLVPERPPPAIDGSRLRTLLIIKLSSIGDVVHALPVASALKRTYPSLHITWAVEDWTAPLVERHPAVDRLVLLPAMNAWPDRPMDWMRQIRASLRALRRDPYDVVIDLQGLARSAVLSRLTRATCRLARAGQREGAHLVSFGVPLPAGRVHAVDEYLAVAKALGAATERPRFELPVSADAERSVDRLLATGDIRATHPLIVVSPSASQGWKEWPAERWVRVLDALTDAGTIVLTGTRRQIGEHARVARQLARPPVDLTGQTTLNELIALLDRASLHVAPDTGTVHIAAALGIPVVAVYGPTRAWRVGPYGQPEGVVYHGDLCGATCPGFCVRARRCLTAATPEEVIEKARATLSRSCGRISAS